jgi:ubiquinone/menaquinone biosynthesis C-methylase UbiE
MEITTMDQNEHMQFFYEIFDSSLPRLGPGDNASTRKAFEMLEAVKKDSRVDSRQSNFSVLDIGCGNGAQTIELAKNVDGTILAVDNHQPFLDELQRRAQEAGVVDKIQVRQQNMAELGQEQKSYDLIWSEGALYSMGFNEGLAMCFNLMAEQGQMAVSELCWHRPDIPKDCLDFFAKEYPPMVDTATNIDTIKQCGYALVGQFPLPGSAWIEGYYLPLEERLKSMRIRYDAEPEKLDLIESIQVEIDMYRQYGQYYGYDFYLMQIP